MDHEPDLPVRQKPPQQQNPLLIHSNLEHLQKSVEKELEENRATVLELDTMKVEQGPVEREHTPVVRKKSRQGYKEPHRWFQEGQSYRRHS